MHAGQRKVIYHGHVLSLVLDKSVSVVYSLALELTTMDSLLLTVATQQVAIRICLYWSLVALEDRNKIQII